MSRKDHQPKLVSVKFFKSRIQPADDCFFAQKLHRGKQIWSESLSCNSNSERHHQLAKAHIVFLNHVFQVRFQRCGFKLVVIEKNDVGFGKLMMPLRIAVTGQGFGPDLFSSMELLGKETVISRLDTALEKLD